MYRKPQWSTIAKLFKATEQRRTIVRHSSIITHWAVRFHVHRSRSEEEKGGGMVRMVSKKQYCCSKNCPKKWDRKRLIITLTGRKTCSKQSFYCKKLWRWKKIQPTPSKLYLDNSEVIFLIFKKVWQRSFISTVRSSVHTNHSRNETFENAPQAGGIWKRRLFIFVWTENILKTEPFENDDHTVMVLFFFSEFFSNTNPKTFARKYRTIPISSPWVSEDDPKMTGDLKISPV